MSGTGLKLGKLSRLWSGLAAATFAVVIISLGGWWFTLSLGVIVHLALLEFFRLAQFSLVELVLGGIAQGGQDENLLALVLKVDLHFLMDLVSTAIVGFDDPDIMIIACPERLRI